jgi:ubiquinone biosynthesis protein
MLKLIKPEWIRDRFEDGGPTCIKLGQFIANRKDIFGSDLSNAMVKLQDRVKPVPWHSISESINFSDFNYVNETPIATASIAQVHRGILKNGKDVALKIKKPDVERILKRDLNLLSVFFPDIRESIERELDFRTEVNNLKAFGKMYEYSDTVIVPKVYDNLCSDNVIVMDYVPSERVSTDAKQLITLFINQLLYENYVHGDLHSGNIGMIGNSIVLYDFGNVIRTSKKYRSLMRDLVYHVQNKDIDKTINTMSNLGMVIIHKEVTRNFIKKFFKYIDTLDMKSFNFDVDEIQEKVPLKLDKTTANIIRSYSLLEGYCKKIDPNLSYMDILSETIETMYMDIDYIMYRAEKDLKSILENQL